MPIPRDVWHKCQAFGLGLGVQALRGLGPERSSNLGGWLLREVGPYLGASRVADRNLRNALPGLCAAERKKIIQDVWENLGRTATELPHLESFHRTLAGPGWEIEGEEHITPLIASGRQVIFFSGHFGNWEMILPIAASLKVQVAGIYRAASNKLTDAMIQSLRQNALGPGVPMFRKGPEGAKEAMAHLRNGGSLGLLVDQKLDEGIAIPFFGNIAMTAPAIARFALRFQLPIIPVRVMRVAPARFRMVCEPSLPLTFSGDRNADTIAILTAVNATLERWIRCNPGAWLWLHRRWPKETTPA